MTTASPTDLNSLLVSKPGYRNGWPCLRGTGIPVHNVAAHYLDGVTIQAMCKDNPDLDPSLFYAAVAYFLANRELIEQQLEEDGTRNEQLAVEHQKADPEHVTIFRA